MPMRFQTSNKRTAGKDPGSESGAGSGRHQYTVAAGLCARLFHSFDRALASHVLWDLRENAKVFANRINVEEIRPMGFTSFTGILRAVSELWGTPFGL